MRFSLISIVVFTTTFVSGCGGSKPTSQAATNTLPRSNVPQETIGPVVEEAAVEIPKPNEGPLGMKFIGLPKATTHLGGGGGNYGKKTEIEEAFEIAIYPVTQGEWESLMGKNPSCFSHSGQDKNQVKDIDYRELWNFPVENVSWEDCIKFVRKLNEREKGKGWTYDLPTEEVWEYACRGGATADDECAFDFYFAKPTNDLSSKFANFDGTMPAGKAEKGIFLLRTTKVGSYPPNKLGLYDMHGNVWQWTLSTNGPYMIHRGGSWKYYGSWCRAATSKYAQPLYACNDIGLRLVRVKSSPVEK